MRTFISSHAAVSVSFAVVIVVWLLTAHDTSAFKYRTIQINLVGSDRWLMDVPRRKMFCNMVPDYLSESTVDGIMSSVVTSERILQQQQQLFLLLSSFVPQATVQPYEREPLVW